MTPHRESLSIWGDAILAARLLAIDPVGLCGAVVRAQPGGPRDHWVEILRAYLPAGAPVCRLPVSVSDDRLLGGIDLAATLHLRTPVVQRGILAASDGGLLIISMAERINAMTAARIAGAQDLGAVTATRHAQAERQPARFGVVALDEGMDRQEQPPTCLTDRLAFHIDLSSVAAGDISDRLDEEASLTEEARRRLTAVRAETDVMHALCSAASELGIESLRAELLALRAAHAHAAMEGRTQVSEPDALAAARLVLAPRARQLPPPPSQDAAPQDGHAQDRKPEQEPTDHQDSPGTLADALVKAAKAALPPGILIDLAAANGARGAAGVCHLAKRRGALHGRQTGVRRGDPRGGARLDVIETLKAAAPWQKLRKRGWASRARAGRIEVRRGDFHIRRFKPRTVATTIFVVDASGSTAAQRLSEAKGAVELLLGECYVRRDQVALLAFRGNKADILLPPTRSLARAKRSLGELPGGGGTPLASAIAAALAMATTVRSAGQAPFLVFLTDGSANVKRDGKPERREAEAEALLWAKHVRNAGMPAVLIDTSQRPRPVASQLAAAMGARYLPLPRADATTLSQAVRASTPTLPV